jgi:predicted nucleic acid-binding protein
LEDIGRRALKVEDLVSDDYRRIGDLCERYSDARLGFVDASVVAVAERLSERKIATLDHRHFRLVRPRHVVAFELLP